jgi:hypothetical protein
LKIYEINNKSILQFTGDRESYEHLDLTDSVFDERPDMIKLRYLELPKSSYSDERSLKLDVAERIAHSYKEIGGELLQDSDGVKVSIIHDNNHHNIVDTNENILRVWLQGSGKRPVTWRTLIQVLEKHGKVQLAKDIRTALLYEQAQH